MKRILCLIAAVLLLVPAAAAADLPGVLADVTEQAAVFANEKTGTYDFFYFDYDGDGDEERFCLVGYGSSDGTRPVGVAIYTGPGLNDLRFSPPKHFKDVSDILFVGFIDVDPEDGAKDLVFSVRTPDGRGETMIVQGVIESTGEKFGNMWMDPKGGKILEGDFRGFFGGVIVLGDTAYARDEGFYLKETDPPEMPEPALTEEPVPEPTAALTEEPAPGPTEAPTEEPAPAPTEEPVAIPTDAPAPVPAGDSGIPMDVRFVAVTYIGPDRELDAAVLGAKYSFTLHADGTADFTLSGTPVPGLAWRVDGADTVIDYFGAGEIRLTPEEDGRVLMVFMGAMTLRMSGE